MELLSNFIAKQRRAKVLTHVRGDVLELGCGAGRLYALCRERLDRYVGIDVSEQVLARAAENFPGIEFLRRDIDTEELGFENAFDSILMVALIEHIFNQGFLLGQCFRALRPEMSSSRRRPLWETISCIGSGRISGCSTRAPWTTTSSSTTGKGLRSRRRNSGSNWPITKSSSSAAISWRSFTSLDHRRLPALCGARPL